jgi:hypothetical protein
MTVREYAEKLRTQTIGGETESGRMLAEALTSQYGNTQIPEEFEVTAYRMAKMGDMVLWNDGRVNPSLTDDHNRSSGARLILKAKPKHVGFIVKLTGEVRPPVKGEYFLPNTAPPGVVGCCMSVPGMYNPHRIVTVEDIYE